jgi:hypothetical protein
MHPRIRSRSRRERAVAGDEELSTLPVWTDVLETVLGGLGRRGGE